MIIYRIVDMTNNKMYIGQTIERTVDKRWREHKCSAGSKNRPLYNAMFAHGLDNFEMDIVEMLPEDATKEMLDAAEIKWIAEFKTLVPDGYNIKPGGEGQFKMTGDHKKAISEAQKRRWSNIEITDEIKERLRQAALGNRNRAGKAASDETRARISAAQMGKVCSDETRAKMSAAHKARLAGHPERTPAQLAALAKARESLVGKEPWNKGMKKERPVDYVERAPSMERRIQERFLKRRAFTKKQTKYIKEKIDPKFENDCQICMFNLGLYLGVPAENDPSAS